MYYSKQELREFLDYLREKGYNEDSTLDEINEILNEESVNRQEIKNVEEYYSVEDEDEMIKKYFHVKQIVYAPDKDPVYILDRLEIENYAKVSFSKDVVLQRMLFFDEELSDSTKEEYENELCYYFRRLPGVLNQELCCPSEEN